MSGCTVWVSYDVFRKADVLIGGTRDITAPGQSIREGIELLLKGNLTIDGDNAGSRTGSVDASVLLAKGFTMLRNNPYEALGLQTGAKTQEIRKAYKKAALLYHPDKNPKTTPLFQAIQLACDKLSDREERIEAEKEVERRQRASVAPVASVSKPYSYQQEPQQKKQNKEKTSISQTRQEESTPQFRRDNLYERYYPGEPTARSGADKSQVPSQQDYRQRHNEAVEEVTKRAKHAADAARRCEYEMKARDAAERRAFDFKVVAMREAAAQKQRDKDAIIKDGQKQYFDEQAKLRVERIAKERAVAEAAMASRRAMYSNIASTTPDSSVLPTSYLYRNVNAEATNPRGVKQMSPRTSNVPGFKAPTIPPSVKVNSADVRQSDHIIKSIPVTGPLKEGGGVNVQQTSSSCSTYSKAQATRSRKHVVPIPSDFNCTAVSDSAVELEWKKSAVSNVPVLIQLSWRKQVALAQWQSATRLISGQKCRKNNLELGAVGGSLYEFRVRAIEDLPGGMLGKILCICNSSADRL
jgi:curved DNA-binding protein CbpA